MFEGGWKNTKHDRLEVFSIRPCNPPPPPPHPHLVFNLFIDTEVILSYVMVWDIFNTFRLLRYNKIKKLRGDSFSQLVRLREL